MNENFQAKLLEFMDGTSQELVQWGIWTNGVGCVVFAGMLILSLMYFACCKRQIYDAFSARNTSFQDGVYITSSFVLGTIGILCTIAAPIHLYWYLMAVYSPNVYVIHLIVSRG